VIDEEGEGREKEEGRGRDEGQGRTRERGEGTREGRKRECTFTTATIDILYNRLIAVYTLKKLAVLLPKKLRKKRNTENHNRNPLPVKEKNLGKTSKHFKK
jgi:hypothetical protein